MSSKHSKSNARHAAGADDFVMDISSGTPVAADDNYADGYGGHAQPPKGSKKKPVIIACVAVGVAAVAAIAGFIVFNQFNKKPATPDEPTVFTYAENTKVSGIDISGKTREQAKKLLEQNESSFASPITININAGGKTYQLKEQDFGYIYNIDEVLAQAQRDAEAGQNPTGETGPNYTVTATVTDDSITKNVGKISDEVDAKPKNAYVTEFRPYEENRFDFAEATDGATLNASDLKDKIKDCFVRGNNVSMITADVETEKAEMDMETLKSRLVKLSSYQTVSYNTANGTSNMQISLEACNGSIIEPGEEWSFNDCTGDSNLESLGYKPASVILEGKIVDGIGGGICQSSSTIYNAAIRADLDIEERHNHQWPSDYVPTGLDATIDYPNLDLKLSNPTDYQVFLECRLEGSTLYASFWGVKSDKWDEIHTLNQIGDTGGSTYTVYAWRVYFKDGSEVDREQLGTSTYDSDRGLIFSEADNDVNANTNGGSTNHSSSGSSTASSYAEQSYESSSSETESYTPQSETPSELPMEGDSSYEDDSSGETPAVPDEDY